MTLGPFLLILCYICCKGLNLHFRKCHFLKFDEGLVQLAFRAGQNGYVTPFHAKLFREGKAKPFRTARYDHMLATKLELRPKPCHAVGHQQRRGYSGNHIHKGWLQAQFPGQTSNLFLNVLRDQVCNEGSLNSIADYSQEQYCTPDMTT